MAFLRYLERWLYQKIAQDHHASIPQIIIAWGLSRQIVMIPKSVTPSRIEENFAALKIMLSDDED